MSPPLNEFFNLFKFNKSAFINLNFFDFLAFSKNLAYDSVQPLINEHLQGRTNRRLLIWSLLNLDKYYLN